MSVKVLKLGATWCSSCKSLSSLIPLIITNIETEEVDIDVDIEVVKQYGVRGVPVLLAIKDGEKVSQLNGAQTLQKLQEWYDAVEAM